MFLIVSLRFLFPFQIVCPVFPLVDAVVAGMMIHAKRNGVSVFVRKSPAAHPVKYMMRLNTVIATDDADRFMIIPCIVFHFPST